MENQLTIFDITDDLPESNDYFRSDKGKMRIVGIYPTWRGPDVVVWTEKNNFAKALAKEKFLQKVKEGEFVRL